MLINLKKNFFNKMESFGRSEQLYIIPTADGLKLLVLNLILLIVGLVYANNYVLLFNFILFCLFLGSMYYTHFNLHGLKLVSARFSPMHVSENVVFTLQFRSTSALGHYFLGLRIKNSLFKIQNSKFTFSLNMKDQKTFKVDIPVTGIKRGEQVLNKICIETLFPFHLFRSFVYFKSALPIIVYPERKDLKIHGTCVAFEDKSHDGENFTLNDFKIGDSLKRVHWKKLAQTNRWYSKNLLTPTVLPVMLSIDNTSTQKGIEEQLSSICFALYQLHFQNTKYGLTIGNIVIPPGHSNMHLKHCLYTLAEYGN